MLREFTKDYKKTQEFIDHGRHGCRMDSKNLKAIAATKALFDVVRCPNPVDMSGVSRTVSNGFFLTGLAPRATCAGLTPNGAGMLRVMHMGEIQSLLVPMKGLKEAAGVLLSEESGVQRFLENLTSNQIEDLHAKGVRMYYLTQTPQSVLYVPIGWAIVDKVISGQVVCHVRSCVGFQSNVLFEGGMAAADYFPKKDQAKVRELINMCKPS